MKFDKPATKNPIDQLRFVGKPFDRVDGPLKTTGTARSADPSSPPSCPAGSCTGAHSEPTHAT